MPADAAVVDLLQQQPGRGPVCQLTADACGLPVEAGPVEAAALGNVLVQARRAGLVGPDPAAMRALLRATQPIRRYEPRGDRGVGRHGGPGGLLLSRLGHWQG